MIFSFGILTQQLVVFSNLPIDNSGTSHWTYVGVFLCLFKRFSFFLSCCPIKLTFLPHQLSAFDNHSPKAPHVTTTAVSYPWRRVTYLAVCFWILFASSLYCYANTGKRSLGLCNVYTFYTALGLKQGSETRESNVDTLSSGNTRPRAALWHWPNNGGNRTLLQTAFPFIFRRTLQAVAKLGVWARSRKT